MSKPNVAGIIKRVQSAVVKHSPEILVGLGISGMVATTVLAVRATPKALSLLEQKAREEECRVEDLTAGEKVKTCWKCYIPAAITCATSTACIIGAQTVNGKRNAALAAAYTLSESALREYKDKVIETIGEEKERVVREKIHEDRLQKNPVETREVYLTGKGEVLCHDLLSGRYFESDRNEIKRAENNLNEQLLNDMYVSLNDLYDELDLEHTRMGDELGWRSIDGQVRIELSSKIATDGRPCLVLDFNRAPRYDYTSLY